MAEPLVALVTGANTGIGRVTALELARGGMRVFLACRSAERAAPVLDEIRTQAGQAEVESLPLELGDLASVRRCAEAFLARQLPLHLLVNNAGVSGGRALTASGFELAFGVNHLGHFLLTELLRERLQDSGAARIVNVASRAHVYTRGIDFEAVRRPATSPMGMREYAVSKLANVLHASELASKLAGTGVTSYSLHPGAVASDLGRSLPWPLRTWVKHLPGLVSVERGARTTLHCARAAEVATESGLYYDDCRVARPSQAATDPRLAGALWERSRDWTQAA